MHCNELFAAAEAHSAYNELFAYVLISEHVTLTKLGNAAVGLNVHLNFQRVDYNFIQPVISCICHSLSQTTSFFHFAGLWGRTSKLCVTWIILFIINLNALENMLNPGKCIHISASGLHSVSSSTMFHFCIFITASMILLPYMPKADSSAVQWPMTPCVYLL